jgi:hypothetical protein
LFSGVAFVGLFSWCSHIFLPVFLVQSYIPACCGDVLCFVLACFAGAGAILALYVASSFWLLV